VEVGRNTFKEEVKWEGLTKPSELKQQKTEMSKDMEGVLWSASAIEFKKKKKMHDGIRLAKEGGNFRKKPWSNVAEQRAP